MRTSVISKLKYFLKWVHKNQCQLNWKNIENGFKIGVYKFSGSTYSKLPFLKFLSLSYKQTSLKYFSPSLSSLSSEHKLIDYGLILFCLSWLFRSSNKKVLSSALTQMVSECMFVAHSLLPLLLFFSQAVFHSPSSSSLTLSSLSLSLSPLDHLGPLLHSLSLTPTQLCHSLTHSYQRSLGTISTIGGSSSCLCFVRWTHFPQSPFLPRRVPRWQRSPFPGWASGGRPWWQLLWGSCWSWFWWSSYLCWSAPLAQVAQMTVRATMRC